MNDGESKHNTRHETFCGSFPAKYLIFFFLFFIDVVLLLISSTPPVFKRKTLLRMKNVLALNLSALWYWTLNLVVREVHL